MKQTAVEWYAEQEVMLTLDLLAKKINDVEYSLYKLELFNKAKEMEKQQITNCYENAYGDGYIDNGGDGEQYYNEIFKSEE
jgi:hypothetical protein